MADNVLMILISYTIIFYAYLLLFPSLTVVLPFMSVDWHVCLT
jgi:hypothetical protein